MSRLAKKAIVLPDGVKVTNAGSVITVEGKLGKLQQVYAANFVDIKVENNQIMVNRKGDSNAFRAYQGLYWSLIRNAVNGVSQGFTKVLLIQGLGYKWEIKGKNLVITAGYSNPVNYAIPQGVTLAVENNNQLKITGFDKQLVGEISAQIRAIRPPEPYKGKGIRYIDEVVKLKEGKSAK